MLPTEGATPMETSISPYPEAVKTPVFEYRRSDLLCRVQYSNKLPDIPFDLKFLIFPFKSTRFSKYTQSTLERNHKHEFLTDYNMGIEVDLIDIQQYECAELEAQLHPEDEKLLEDDYLTLPVSKRSKTNAKSVSWLRRTEYISTETTRFQPHNVDKIEAKVGGKSIKKYIAEGILYLDHEQQLKAIDKTFIDSKKPIEKHYSKPNVYPVQVLPVYPDFQVWKHPCAQVIFDSDPTPIGYSAPQQIELMSQAMLRGVMDENEEQFVAYFLPTNETLEKRKRDKEIGVDYQESEIYEYKMFKEYNWNVKSKSTEGYEENYFMVLRDDGLYYNELETRVRLSKRRKAGNLLNRTTLIVKNRQLNNHELKVQELRTRHLKLLTADNVEDNKDDDAVNSNEEEKDDNDDEQSEDDNYSGKSSRSGSRTSRSRSRSLSSSKSTDLNSHVGSQSSIKSGQNTLSVEIISGSNVDGTDEDTEEASETSQSR